jgi:hypothetical protein
MRGGIAGRNGYAWAPSGAHRKRASAGAGASAGPRRVTMRARARRFRARIIHPREGHERAKPARATAEIW